MFLRLPRFPTSHGKPRQKQICCTAHWWHWLPTNWWPPVAKFSRDVDFFGIFDPETTDTLFSKTWCNGGSKPGGGKTESEYNLGNHTGAQLHTFFILHLKNTKSHHSIWITKKARASPSTPASRPHECPLFSFGSCSVGLVSCSSMKKKKHVAM